MSYAAYIREIARGPNGANDLSYADSRTLYDAMLSGKVPDLEIGAIITAFRLKGETLEEMHGFSDAAHINTASLLPPAYRDSFRPIVIPSYNGARKIPNLTPLLALALRSFNVPVVVHGLEDEFGRVTTARVFSELDISPVASLAEAQSHLQGQKIAFIPLPILSPGLTQQLTLRNRTGLRNSAHSLVKMLDPFKGDGIVIMAATHPEYIDSMRRTALNRGQCALLLRATEGEPFANPKRRPAIEFIHGKMVESLYEAEHESLKLMPNLPEESDAVTTAAWISQVLQGNVPMPSPVADQLAACLFACGHSESLTSARAAILSRLKIS